MPDLHDEMLRDWREHAPQDEDSNFRFLHSLKMVDSTEKLDRQARAAHHEVFAAIDCTRCANCCQTMKAQLDEPDIQRIATHLGMTRKDFIAAYLETHPEDGGYRINTLPCPFLADDVRCRIYEHRPRVCREFPHTDREGFASRTYLHSANTLNCPAVYQIAKRLRQRRRGAG
jgi:Fe-S-cluster containining protein